MGDDAVQEILSSKTRLKIADLLSTRPRTLKELADASGISVQAVLKHLDKIDKLGLLREQKVAGGGVQARKLYSVKGVRLGDFSTGGVTIVKMTESVPVEARSKDVVSELESLAEDALVQRRRIREEARRLGRLIDGLVESETRLDWLISSLGLDDGDALVLRTVYTEETLEDAERVLGSVYGFADPRRSIDRAIGKAKRSAK